MFLHINFVIFILGFQNLTLVARGELPPIAFKFVDNYKRIWNDKGSGAHRDVAIWRPVDYQNGYYPLGDAAAATHSRPNTLAMTVMALESDALAEPASFTSIWNDKGSGARKDVTIYRMNPSSGYTCLGHIAVGSYKTQPSKSNYRCVKSNYLTTGTYELIWKDHGSGAKKDVGLWSNTELGSTYGLFSNTFTSVRSHSTLSGSPKLLHGDYAKLYSLIDTEVDTENLAITVYEGTDYKRIWNDRGSGGKHDVSIYRAKSLSDYYSLGDIAIKGYGKPKVAHVAKALKSDALKAPQQFRQRWNDKGSGAREDLSIWEPICPSGYVSLGYVAVRSHRKKPRKTDIMCVKRTYITSGKWKWVWNDKRTGARKDVAFWRGDARSSYGQGVNAMKSNLGYKYPKLSCYVLRSKYVQYVVGQPATSYVLLDVEYFFDDRQTLSSTPEELARTIVENKGSTEQTATRSIEYSYEETHDWSQEYGLEIGVETSVTAGIPDIAEASVTLSVTTTSTQSWGESITTSKTDTIEVEITVQPMSQKTATVVSTRYTADIPYTATLITFYADGTKGVRENYTGVYRGAHIDEVRVVLDEDIPLEG